MFELVFLLLPAGVLFYYFQESVRKTAPDHELVGESSQVGPLSGSRGWHRLTAACIGVTLLDLKRSVVCVSVNVRILEKLPASGKESNTGSVPCGLAPWSPPRSLAVAWTNPKKQVTPNVCEEPWNGVQHSCVNGWW